MTLRFSTTGHWGSALLLMAFLMLASSAGEAHAQFVYKWLSVGDLHAYYTEAGSHNEDYNGHNIQWPGIRQNVGNVRGYAMWIGAENFTDEDGETWQYKIAHVGPRITGLGEVFPQGFQMVSRFEPPQAFVDDFESIYRPVFNDEVDPSMKADRAIQNTINTVIGVEMDRTVMAFSQEYHDDYHITEYNFTNTGNTDDDEEVELPNQTLNNVYFHFQNRYATNNGAGWIQEQAQGWGKWQMNDAVGDEHEDYDVDFRAQYSWLGNVPGITEDYQTTVGGPVWYDNNGRIARGDTIGRLGAANFLGKVYIHADDKAYPAGTPLGQRVDGTELPYSQAGAQPATMGKIWTGDERTHVNDHRDEALMAKEWDLITSGREYPHHADLVLASNGTSATQADFAKHSGDPTLGQGSDGFGFVESFGPYNMAPGETVTLVIAEGVASLSDEATVEIGRAYRRAGGRDNVEIEYDANGDGTIDAATERMNKNSWVMTSRDSLFQMFERAIANFESGYNIPQPPLPPAEFSVTSGVDQIEINWTPQESPPNGWELWRAEGRYDGLPIRDEYIYKRIATLDPGATNYLDSDVARGLDYYYYLQAVGPVNMDDTGLTPTGVPLKSSRHYAQTYQPAQLKRGPGSSLEAARIVPNPYNLETEEEVRFSTRDQLAFLDIPGNSTIRIFTEMGELVKTIKHEDGSGDDAWDMQTESQQLVSSGIYIAAITDEDIGETIYRKFVIIR